MGPLLGDASVHHAISMSGRLYFSISSSSVRIGMPACWASMRFDHPPVPATSNFVCEETADCTVAPCARTYAISSSLEQTNDHVITRDISCNNHELFVDELRDRSITP
jgi:hypothetical protein